MTKDTTLPPNIQEFNEITAVVFSLLYEVHPIPRDVYKEDAAKLLGVSPTAPMPSGRAFDEVFMHTVIWLHGQDFVKTQVGSQHIGANNFLTAKALVAMNRVPAALGKTTGTALAEEVGKAKSESGAGKIGEFIGGILGGFANTQ